MGRIKYRPTKVVYCKLDERFELGKHKGKTVEWVIRNDIGYINLYSQTVEGFELKDCVKDLYDELRKPHEGLG